MSNILMQKLEKVGVPTHFVEELNDRETVVKRVKILPLEVIVRNISAGSFAKRYGVEEGIPFETPTIEFSYKNDGLGDPLLNAYHAIALGLCTEDEIETVKKYAFAVNEQLKVFWATCGITLVDFKIEFGKLSDGTIVLADEISPDTCRLWDSKTSEKLDKDRFRRDLGGVEDAYAEGYEKAGRTHLTEDDIMVNCAIVGINWGDEGKGRMVDLLTEIYDIVVRFQGGGNAGHTVINDKGNLPCTCFRPESSEMTL